jgi:hypothetical protein
MSGVKRTAEDMSSSDDDCVFLYEVNTEAAAPPEASPDASSSASPSAELESSPAHQGEQAILFSWPISSSPEVSHTHLEQHKKQRGNKLN